MVTGLWTLLAANAQTLSSNAKISLLTCDPGEELYSVFGHSAVRVCDSINHIDWVYNYGTFDFNTPNFYLKFAKGDLNYQLSVYKFKYFLPEYFAEGRSVIEQELNLSPEAKQLLFERLNTNALPEHKNYRYDFFFDNCATRIRDQVVSLEGTDKVVFSSVSQEKTFRELYGEYLKDSPWIEFGIHLLLGMKADKTASAHDEMYLPDFLYFQFRQAKIAQRDGREVGLVANESKLLDFPKSRPAKGFWLWPSTVFALLLLVVLLVSYFDLKRGKNSRTLDLLLFIPSVLAGLLFVFLWFFTKHSVTDSNLNLLWANPLNAFLLFLSCGKFFQSKAFRYLAVIAIALNVVFVLFYISGIQHFPPSLILVVLALTTRLAVMYFNSGAIKRVKR